MSYSSAVLADSPVAYLRLGETSSTFADSSASGTLTGTLVGSGVTRGTASLLTGDANGSFTITGEDCGINLGNPSALRITGQITLECIIKPGYDTDDASLRAIISKGYDGSTEGYVLGIFNGVAFVGCYNGSNHQAAYALPANSWDTTETRHMAGVYNGTAWKLYFNGVEVATSTDAIGAIATGANVAIGGEYITGTLNRSSISTIDEVAIYNTALSPTRILAHYTASVSALSVTPTCTRRTNTSVAFSYSVSNGTGPYSVQLKRAATSGGTLTSIGDPVTGSTGNLIDTTASAGTTYYYKVVVTDATTDTSTSSEQTILTFTTLQYAYVARAFLGCVHFSIDTFAGLSGSGDLTDGGVAVDLFNPTNLNVGQWLDSFVAAGMRGAMLTVKHWAGFKLWPSANGPYGIISTTWYAGTGRDIVQEFVNGCRARGLAIIFYMGNDQYFRLVENPGHTQAQFKARLEADFTELLSNYGAIDAIFWDVDWAGAPFGNGYPWASNAAQQAFIHGLQPNCLFINNDHSHTLAASQIVEYEGGTVGEDPAVTNTDPAEKIDSITTPYWFLHSPPQTPTTAAQVVADLAFFNARNCAYQLNCPPDTTGQLPAAIVAVLREVGRLRGVGGGTIVRDRRGLSLSLDLNL